jgi:hypothetical protein
MPQDKKPTFVGVPSGEDPVVASYRKSVVQRAQRAGDAQKIPVPNLSKAQEQFDPKKDAPMTLTQMGEAQETMDKVAGGERPSQLSSDTVRGLQALRKEVDEVKQKQPPPPVEEEPAARPQEGSQSQLGESLQEKDDLEMEYLLDRLKQDLINNDEQRDLIEKRVKPMSLADGISSGEFKQLVPIHEALNVMYRSVSPMEIEHIRRLVLEMQLRDERLANLSVDRFSLMQTVASIVHINGEALPTHIKDPGTIRAEFLDKPFLDKYAVIGGYPSPFIHTLSTHAYWFDLRVRKLFTMEALKNG